MVASTLISKIMAESWIRVQDGLKHDIDLLDQCWHHAWLVCKDKSFSENYFEEKHFKLFLYLFFLKLNVNFKNLTIGLYAFYVFNTHVKFHLNRILFTINQ